MTVPAVISLITLGVHDVRASTAFYESLGFELSSSSIEGEVSFFHMAGAALGLYGIDDLAADAQSIPSRGDGFGGVTLAVNVGSPAAVDAALGAAEAAGATIPKKGQTAEWGGYSGYFADPDGHLWEVAYNPFWPLDGNGVPQLP
jgi:predicted lactoylglutathione lyase